MNESMEKEKTRNTIKKLIAIYEDKINKSLSHYSEENIIDNTLDQDIDTYNKLISLDQHYEIIDVIKSGTDTLRSLENTIYSFRIS